MNNNIEQLNIEQSTEKGYNITLDLILVEHGEKLGEGEKSKLTKLGEKQVAELVKAMEIPKDGAKIYYSDKIRAQQTSKIIEDNIKISEEQDAEIENLKRAGIKGVGISRKEKLIGIKELDEEIIKKQFHGIANYIETPEELVPQGIHSPKELASNIAQHILRSVKMSLKLPSKTEALLINITHQPNLLSFLKNIIGAQIKQEAINPDGKNFVEKIGGRFNPTERMVIKIIRESPDKYDIILVLRGKEFVITPDLLEDLAKYQRQKV